MISNKMKVNFLKILMLFLIIVSQTQVFAQKDKEKPNKKSPYSINMANGWLQYNNEDYYGALRTYRKIYKDYINDGKLNFRIGQCLIKTYNMDSALYHLKKSIEMDTTLGKDAYFLLGKAYHYKGDLDNAIRYYEKYKTMLKPKQLEKNVVNNLLRQCETAKKLMSNPVNVEIKNMGPNINTKFTDANPSITADGKIFIFTSRRPENIGGQIDPAVEEYFDDIYIAKYDKENHEWGKAVNIGEPINTPGHDANLSITPDGTKILIYKNVTGETKSGDIYYSDFKENGQWSDPKPFGNKYINSSYFETSACLTADGKTLYFVSEREKGGFGHGDIYVSKLVNGEWTKPENLGPTINTEYDEVGVYIHPDGKTLFFSSNGHNTMGGHDIFMSTLDDNGNWTTPINMGYPINTTKEEIHFVFTTDRKVAYLSSSRDGGYGKMDIYKINMAYYFKTNKNIDKELAAKISGPPLSILKGTVINASKKAPVSTNIIIKQIPSNKTFIASSNSKGEYFIALPANEKYELTIKKKGFKPISIKFKLPEGKNETYTLVKHIFLNK